MKWEVAFHLRMGNFHGECPIQETGRHSHCTQVSENILQAAAADTCGLLVCACERIVMCTRDCMLGVLPGIYFGCS